MNMNKSLDSWLNFGGPSSFPKLYAKVTLFSSLSQFQGMLVPMKKNLLTYKNYTSLIFLISPVFMSLCMKVCKESIIILGIAYSKNTSDHLFSNVHF